MKEYSEEVKRLLKEVADHFDKEDTSVRERQILTWRRMKLFWEGFQKVWYSEIAHDWRVWDEIQDSNGSKDQSYYDKPVNVFRAYLESIIAALSVIVPPVKCYPDDAENSLDVSTAHAGDKIAELLFRHNDASLLWLHGLFIWCTEGMTACYNYVKESADYGTYEKKDYTQDTQEHEYTTCPECGYEIDDKMMPPDSAPIDPNALAQEHQLINNAQDEFMPDDADAELNSIVNDALSKELCPACMALMNPTIKQETVTITRLVGITHEPKSRVCIEVYGGLFVKVPNYAMKQEDMPYLEYSYETHYTNMVEKYQHLRDEFDTKDKRIKGGNSGAFDFYEQWGRLSPQYQGESPENVVTCRNFWLRPSSFNILQDEECKELKKLFPNGARVVFVNDQFAEACNESLDDHWTITRNPLSDYIHHDPLGLLLVSIQEITNDLLSLILQTIEHGIPQTFADPTVVNFPAYEQSEVVVGGLVRATPKSGKSLSDAFHEVKTAVLSAEVLPFAQNIQQLGQLVSGALPSLFGGQLEGSGTASEYSMSRAQALQRQQNTWKIFTIWWKTINGKTIPMYIKEVKEDEHDVQRTKDGNFVNVLIRKAELEGKIGRIEIEANENLPITWSQKKDIVMSLLQAANPEILQVIGAPENLPVIREAIGLNDFFVPGEDDVEAEYEEIKLLLNSEPMEMPPDPMMAQQATMMGQPPPPPQELPSIEIDPIIDNHKIRFEIDRRFLISEAGRQAKIDNQPGYKNLLLHAKSHFMAMQQAMMQQAPPPEESGQEGNSPGKGAAPAEKPNKLSNKQAPIVGEGNVSTVQ